MWAVLDHADRPIDLENGERDLGHLAAARLAQRRVQLVVADLGALHNCFVEFAVADQHLGAAIHQALHGLAARGG